MHRIFSTKVKNYWLVNKYGVPILNTESKALHKKIK